MNATVLSFLTIDGAVTVTFGRPLTTAQYSALYQVIQSDHLTSDQLCRELRQMCAEWEVDIVLDVC